MQITARTQQEGTTKSSAKVKQANPKRLLLFHSRDKFPPTYSITTVLVVGQGGEKCNLGPLTRVAAQTTPKFLPPSRATKKKVGKSVPAIAFAPRNERNLRRNTFTQIRFFIFIRVKAFAQIFRLFESHFFSFFRAHWENPLNQSLFWTFFLSFFF